MKRMSKISSLLAGVALVAAACGDSLPTGVNSGDQPSADEVSALVAALFGDLAELGEDIAASRQPNVPLPAGMSLSLAGVPFSDDVSLTRGCEGGGEVELTGTSEGEYDPDTGEGQADFNITQSIDDCVIEAETVTFTVNTDPDIQLIGTLEITENSFSLSFELGGGVSFTTDDEREGSCAIDLSLSFTAEGSQGGSVTIDANGSACNRNINDL